jgi:hypothetical protein
MSLITVLHSKEKKFNTYKLFDNLIGKPFGTKKRFDNLIGKPFGI